MSYVIKHSCGGLIKRIDKNLWECGGCGEVKTGDEIKLDDSYAVKKS